jgi:long-chain fatty acid transport protein
MKMTLLRSFVVLLFSLIAQESLGAGFAVYTQSAASLGQANAVVAHGDDASAIFFNPALLNNMGRSQIQLGTALINIPLKFESDATGKEQKAKNGANFVPTLYAVYQINEKVAAGLGVFSNFGLSTKWPEDWEGRYVATESSLRTFTVNPVISVKVAPNFCVAGGLDILWADVERNKHLNLSTLMLPDVRQKMSGSGTGLGYNLGLLLDLTKNLSVGASYRSAMSVDIDGRVEHDIPAVVPLPIQLQLPNTEASSNLKLPPQAFFGIAYKGIDSFVFEIGGRWEGWSKFKELRVKVDEPVFGVKESVQPKNWKDSYTFNLGVKYRLTDKVAVNAGYQYETSSIPDKTFDPVVPDSSSHAFFLGTSVKYEKFSFGFTYGLRKNKNRNKNNSIDDNPDDGVVNPLTSVNGTYKSNIHMVIMDMTYRF